MMEIAGVLLNVIGGLGLFLLGMKNMSEGLQAVAGNGLRRMIAAVTDNRLLAVAVGTGVTCVVQSSSITTVMVVGLVNSGGVGAGLATTGAALLYGVVMLKAVRPALLRVTPRGAVALS